MSQRSKPSIGVPPLVEKAFEAIPIELNLEPKVPGIGPEPLDPDGSHRATVPILVPSSPPGDCNWRQDARAHLPMLAKEIEQRGVKVNVSQIPSLLEANIDDKALLRVRVSTIKREPFAVSILRLSDRKAIVPSSSCGSSGVVRIVDTFLAGLRF